MKTATAPNVEQEYPNACCRCGFCCLSEICPMGLVMLKIPDIAKKSPCPALQFEGDEAVCSIATYALKEQIPPQEVWEAFGFGKGCCIKARAIRGSMEFDFAALPAETKIRLARERRKTCRP